MFKEGELHETRYCENCLELQQKLQEAMDNYVKLDLSRVKEYNELVDKYKAKEQECEKLKFTLKHTGLLDLMNKNVELKKSLDEIEKICQIKEESSQYVLPSVWQQILDIINKVKEK